MAKAFSVASWNVEHFRGDPTRANRVVDFLRDQKPDVIGIYELEGSEGFSALTTRFPSYSWQITEGAQAQEILVGFKSSLSVFMTQKLHFRSGTTHMRPGLLATITVDGISYILLFLHLASLPAPRGFGLRDDMAIRAIKFRKVLNRGVGGKANYIFLGDLNSMGLEYPYGKDIDADTELRRWDFRASRFYDMHRLEKTHDVTFSNGSFSTIPDGDLDHVYAAKHLKFKRFTRDDGTKADIDVRGWVDKSTDADKNKWIADFSDHSLLYFEVQKV